MRHGGGAPQHGEQHRRQNGDDGDYDQKLDEGKTELLASHHEFSTILLYRLHYNRALSNQRLATLPAGSIRIGAWPLANASL